jgi:hypothetical protein
MRIFSIFLFSSSVCLMFSRNNFPEDKLNIENRFPFVKTIFLDQHEFVGNSGIDFSGYFLKELNR